MLSRLETFEREGVVDWNGARWEARFCFDGNRDRLRAVYLTAADGARPDPAALRRDLIARHGQPLPQAADGTLPHLWEWRDGATLVRLDGRPGETWTVVYERASGSPRQRPAAASPAAAPGARPVTGEWRFVPPTEYGGGKFGWFEPSVPLEFLGFLLICREQDLRPGQIAVTVPLAVSGRPATIEVRVGDGARRVTVRGAADVGANDFALWAVLPGSHPLFGLLAETREDRTLTVTAPGLRRPQPYPLRGALAAYRGFALACGLQPPPSPG